jgi:acetyl/propionyl-CoA carboxylase alpha subunit
MFINYEHEKRVYSVKVERRGDKFLIDYGDNEYTVSAEEVKPGQLKIKVGDKVIKCIISEGKENKFIFIDGNIYKVRRVELSGQKKAITREGTLNSPISGTVVSVKVKEGSKVKRGDVIMVIEAMKMEYLIRAPYNGRIKRINFKEEDQIEIGELTAEIERED